MNITIEKDIKKNVCRLKNNSNSPKKHVIKDYSISGITVKNVPFIKKDSSYMLSGKTLDRIYTLLIENERDEKKHKTISFSNEKGLTLL